MVSGGIASMDFRVTMTRGRPFRFTCKDTRMKLHAFSLACMMALFSGIALAAEPIVIKFTHVVAPNTPKGKAAEYFKMLAEERSGGRVRVDVYPNSQLYQDYEEMDALRIGAVQMLAPSLSKFSQLGIQAFELFDLPYIFPDRETLYRVMDGEIGKRLFRLLESKGMLGLAYWDNGFKHMSANRPLRRLEDFRGLRMRIQPSGVLEAQMKVLGANPRTMAFSEVYPALKRGEVDGTENPVSNLYTQRMHEVQGHLTLSGHGYLGYAVIVNRRFWEGLPTELRRLLEQAVQETTRYERDIAQKENDSALAAVRAAGTTEVHLLPDEERLRWWSVLLPVHKAFEDRIGRDLIRAVYGVASQVKKEKSAGGR